LKHLFLCYEARMPRLVAGLSIPAAFLLYGCGQNTLDTKAAEKAIADNIAKQIGDRPRRVVCPDSIAAEKGGTFSCRVTRSDGRTVLVKAVQRNDKGDFVFAPASRQPKP
jgi:Domain of unknown function (DUF4333)